MLRGMLRYCGTVCIVYSVIAFFNISVRLSQFGAGAFESFHALMTGSFLFFALGFGLLGIRRLVPVEIYAPGAEDADIQKSEGD